MKAQFFKLILVNLPVLFIVFYLSLYATEYVFSDTSQGGQEIVEPEDGDYWIHIRNVSIYDSVSRGLQRDMFVLVIGTHIHKIGPIPLFMMDKDITFNLDGEGRILMPIPTGEQQLENSDKSQAIEEGAPANLLVIEAKSLEDLSEFKDDPEFQGNQNLKEVKKIRLLMKDGEIMKNTLPRTRVARFGLRKIQKREKK